MLIFNVLLFSCIVHKNKTNAIKAQYTSIFNCFMHRRQYLNKHVNTLSRAVRSIYNVDTLRIAQFKIK